MRHIVIEDEKIKSLIKMKDELVLEAKAKEEEMKSLDNELGKILHKMKRLNDKAEQLIEPHKSKDLSEFEYHSGISIKGEELHLQIADRVEDFKEALRKQIAESKIKK